MLLDNQMPRKTGQQVVKELRTFIEHLNLTRTVKLQEPMFVIVSAFLNAAFKQHLESLDIKFYYEKPLSTDELREILKLASCN